MDKDGGEIESLRELLVALLDAAERFTTEADYTVEVGFEEELTDAMDAARSAVVSGEGDEQDDAPGGSVKRRGFFRNVRPRH